ncbi:transcription factor DUO1 [Juglans microcarpa x Juglans regia]|uniref:transcription factor DUO1 n=1 Tax=Juglans microcarpa x Juglans regia TaxID=2249226 RepID=UPI001B7F2629|nr:transcription factor DUO1 [Juglans microcarpa x Juglans regia]
MEANGDEGIRKGPWKAEEDEVLLNHVKKYGPRDWSSIRSKGLLQRTGKSCRLRWVNKLRPNLKNGCKFSLEEERVVIELQAQFGNKWAKIATYLPGRTDNDVKNFWSSRQKRLARILQTSATPSKPQKNKREAQSSHGCCQGSNSCPALEAPKFSSSSEGESSARAQSCSSSFMENSEMIRMVPLPDLVNPKLLNFDTSLIHHEFSPAKKSPFIESQVRQIPFSQIPQPQPDVTFSPESQELLARLEDPSIFDMFGTLDASGLGNGAQLPIGTQLFEPVGSCRNGTKEKIDIPITPDSIFDDFPTDVFDHIEPAPSSSDL